MAWYENAIFYHIYPLGLCGAEGHNEYKEPIHRLNDLRPWIDHIRELNYNALYIGPLFESVGHGYETTDYRKADSRLGTNEDFKELVSYCHDKGIKVIVDAVFNHTGRDFFAFADIREHRESSAYLYWYQNVNLYGNNSFNDGFSYDTWGGYDVLAKLNLANQDVVNYHLETVKFWIDEFDVDGLRLDAADVLNFDFMRQLRRMTESYKEDFWLMGEVIHGNYANWANHETLHSVTNYQLYKAFYSAHNDHNYFEIAHTIERQYGLYGDLIYGFYNFADNHDVERIGTILRDRNNYYPLLVSLYTLPGIPSMYYGSEFLVEGRKERYSDASLRPCLDLKEMEKGDPFYPELIKALGNIRQKESALTYGPYHVLVLNTESFVYSRGDVIVALNNSDRTVYLDVRADGSYRGALTDRYIVSDNGNLHIEIEAHSGEIYIPEKEDRNTYEPVKIERKETVQEQHETLQTEDQDFHEIINNSKQKPYEEMSIEELQAAILAKMEANGPLNERMIRDVRENVYRDSLLTWVRSF